MFNSYNQSQNTDSDALLFACDIALEGLRDDAIMDACNLFLKGMVPDHDAAFRPSVAQLSIEAQRRHDYLNRLDAAASRPAIEHKPAPVGNLVSREKMQALADWARGKISADELAKIAQGSEA